MNHLLHLNPLAPLQKDAGSLRYVATYLSGLHVAESDDPEWDVLLHEFDALADATMKTYRGLFSFVGPHTVKVPLPWDGEYFELGGNRAPCLERSVDAAEVGELIDHVRQGLENPNDPPNECNYEILFGDDRRTIQRLSIIVMVCLDGAIQNMLCNRKVAGARWTAAAYRNYAMLVAGVSYYFCDDWSTHFVER